MTNDSETLGTYANTLTLTDQPTVGAPATTTSRLTPNSEVLNDEKTYGTIIIVIFVSLFGHADFVI